jgi:hypothetical protein
MYKAKNHNSIIIFFRDSNNIKIIMFMEVEEMILFIFDDRSKLINELGT